MFVEQVRGLRKHTARGEWEEVGLLVSSEYLPGFFILAAQLPVGLEPQLRPCLVLPLLSWGWTLSPILSCYLRPHHQ